MNKISKFLISITILLHFNWSTNALNINDHRIAILVNDQLITSYDIVQRMKINAILNGVSITPENNNQIANTVADELIKEKLKNEKLIEYNISVSDEEYTQQEEIFYTSMPFDKNELSKVLEENNINYNEFKNYLTYEISWTKLVSGLFYRLTSTSEIEIDEIMKKNPDITRSAAEKIIIQKQLDLKSGKMVRDMLDEATIEYK